MKTENGLRQERFPSNILTNIYLQHKVRACLSTLLAWLCTTTLLLLITGANVYGLQNNIGAHDPSSIVKDGDTYWIFTTGDGIYACTSTDMVKWTAAKTPFTKTAFPSWIKTYVSDFAGTFWAPECFFMNGKYYLFYACSTFGSKISCIGLATSPSLNNPKWTDEGVVVHSTNSNNYNTIDPDVFFDAAGKLWLSFGSWNTGIKMIELDTQTAKPLNTTVYSTATFTDAENSQVVRNGDYYYLFVNRGLCCKGSKSTYYIQVGRSTTPTGPYTGWKTMLKTSGNFVGPGAIGYYKENNTEWATFHYYDSDKGGAATLGIGQFTWKNGWPVVTLNWLNDGYYKITNANSGKVWQDMNCNGTADAEMVQNTWNSKSCQVWNFVAKGNGFYNILSQTNGLAVASANCSNTLGASLQLSAPSDANCQLYHIEKTNVGNYVISLKSGNRIVEVAGSSVDDGANIALMSYTGNANQRWTLDSAAKDTGTVIKNIAMDQATFTIFPNPSMHGSFTISLKHNSSAENATVALFDLQGHSYLEKTLDAEQLQQVHTSLKPGVYIVRLTSNAQVSNQKLFVQ